MEKRDRLNLENLIINRIIEKEVKIIFIFDYFI
jgi:hypothetical protein